VSASQPAPGAQKFHCNGLKRARPAGLVKKMNDDMCQESQAVPHAAHLVLMGRRDKRPVDEHGRPITFSCGMNPQKRLS